MPIWKFCHFWLTKNVRFWIEFNVFSCEPASNCSKIEFLDENYAECCVQYQISLIFNDFHQLSRKCQITLSAGTLSTEFSQTSPLHHLKLPLVASGCELLTQIWRQDPDLCSILGCQPYIYWLSSKSQFFLGSGSIALRDRSIWSLQAIYIGLAQNLSFSSVPVILLYETEVSGLYKPFCRSISLALVL